MIKVLEQSHRTLFSALREKLFFFGMKVIGKKGILLWKVFDIKGLTNRENTFFKTVSGSKTR